jgi:hypothetical protein
VPAASSCSNVWKIYCIDNDNCCPSGCIPYSSGLDPNEDNDCSECSVFTALPNCIGTGYCEWCTKCGQFQNKHSSFTQDTCTNLGGCVYTCAKGVCGAECSIDSDCPGKCEDNAAYKGICKEDCKCGYVLDEDCTDSGKTCVDGECVCADKDGDGYGYPADTRCSHSEEDCNDNNANINPGAAEVCDLADNNCDGAIDEENAQGCSVYYKDEDNDGYGLTADTKCLCSAQGDYDAAQGNDCNDNDAGINPGASEICGNDKDDNCDGQQNEGCEGVCDTDGDGYDEFWWCAGGGPNDDCDDDDPDRYPGNLEICDGKDNDCDGYIDETHECGTDYWTSDYGCSGSTKQRKLVKSGCSGGSCYNYEEWNNIEICGSGDYNDCTGYGSWSCKDSSTKRQSRTCYKKGCSEGSCYTTGWTDHYDYDCRLVGKVCSGGICVAAVASLSATHTTPCKNCGSKPSCPEPNWYYYDLTITETGGNVGATLKSRQRCYYWAESGVPKQKCDPLKTTISSLFGTSYVPPGGSINANNRWFCLIPPYTYTVIETFYKDTTGSDITLSYQIITS